MVDPLEPTQGITKTQVVCPNSTPKTLPVYKYVLSRKVEWTVYQGKSSTIDDHNIYYRSIRVSMIYQTGTGFDIPVIPPPIPGGLTD